MSTIPALSAPSAGTLQAVRRLIDAQARDEPQARKLLAKWYPRAPYAAFNAIIAAWLDATTPADPAASVPVVVTPIDGRVRESLATPNAEPAVKPDADRVETAGDTEEGT